MPEPVTAEAVDTTQPLDSIFERPASGDEGVQEENPETVDSGEDGAQPEAEDIEQSTQDDHELLALVETFAQPYGIKDLQDPEALKTIDLPKLFKRLADKDSYIAKLKGEQATKPPEVKWDDGLAAPGKPEEKLAEEVPAKAQPDTKPEDAGAVDVGVTWKKQADAIAALNDAYADGDYDKVAEVENAMWKRQFTGMALPLIQQYQQEMRQALDDLRGQIESILPDLKEVLPDLRGTTLRKQNEQDKEFVLGKLKENEEYADLIDPLFEEQDGPKIEFNGKEYQNTPYNRILIDNPYLLKVREEDENPRVAQRKTFYTRMEAALKIFRKEKEGALGPEKAQELVEAGKQLAERNGKDRVRHGLNAGSGSKQKGGKAEKDYAQILQDLPGTDSVDEIFR